MPPIAAQSKPQDEATSWPAAPTQPSPASQVPLSSIGGYPPLGRAIGWLDVVANHTVGHTRRAAGTRPVRTSAVTGPPFGAPVATTVAAIDETLVPGIRAIPITPAPTTQGVVGVRLRIALAKPPGHRTGHARRMPRPRGHVGGGDRLRGVTGGGSHYHHGFGARPCAGRRSGTDNSSQSESNGNARCHNNSLHGIPFGIWLGPCRLVATPSLTQASSWGNIDAQMSNQLVRAGPNTIWLAAWPPGPRGARPKVHLPATSRVRDRRSGHVLGSDGDAAVANLELDSQCRCHQRDTLQPTGTSLASRSPHRRVSRARH